jgi:hypothetical protein
MANNIETAKTQWHRFVERLTNADTPAAGYWNMFFKSNGLNIKKPDGTVIPVTAPEDLSNWGSFPDSDLYFASQASGGGSLYRVRGDELRLYARYPINANISAVTQSLMWVVFDDTTDRTLTISTGTIVEGHSVRAQCKQVSGGTGHSILLPSGVTWDGTNRRVILDSTSDRFEAIAESATRFLIWENTGCTFAAS